MSAMYKPHFYDPKGAYIDGGQAEGFLHARGTTVPADTTAGFAPGCLFLHTDGSDGTLLYINTGSLTSCSFKPVPAVSTTLLVGLQFRDFHVWDAIGTNPVTTGANDDLALTYNTLGTAYHTVETGDLKASTTTRFIGGSITMPANYINSGSIVFRLNAGMKTTVADNAATIDAQVYRAAAPTVDICATAAQSINSLTAADKNFTITATDVVAGEILSFRIAMAVTDAATGTAVIGKMNLAGSGFLLTVSR